MRNKILLLLGCLSFANLFAQDTSSILGEVVVTANKFPVKSTTTGKVLKLISRDQLERSGGKDLSQVITEQTGIVINGANSNPGKDKSIYMRGARADYTLITIDGVPVYDPSGIGSNFDIRLLSLDQIDHIEVLMGSQSTLYGADAMAGVINIITKKAETKKAIFSGNISYGSNQTLRTGASMSFGLKQVDYQMQVAQLNTAGIDEAVKNTSIRDRRDRDDYDQFNFQQTLNWQIKPHAKLTLYHRASNFNQSYDQGAFVDELDLTSTNKNSQAGMRAEYAKGNTRLFFNYNYHENRRFYWDDSTLSRNGYDIYSKGNYNSREHFADFYAVLPVLSSIRLTIGADYRQSNSDQYYLSVSSYGNYETTLSKDSLKQDQLGIYGSAIWKATPTLNVELGGRLNRHSEYGSNQVYSLNISKMVQDRLKLFANVGGGYKTPSLYQLYSEYGNRELKPEMANTWETGFQFFLNEQKNYVRMLWFDRQVKDVMIFYTNPLTYQSNYINQDRQHDLGLEFDAQFSLSKKSIIRINGTFVDGQITTQKNGKDTTYNNLYRRPRNQCNVQYEQYLPKGWFISAGLIGTGKRIDLWFDPATYQQKEVSLPSYVLFNLYVSHQVPKRNWTFFADLRNLANEPFTEIYGYNTLGFNGSLGMRFSIQQEKRVRARKAVSLP